MEDKVDIGLSKESQQLIQSLDERGWFADHQDIARFCMAYAIRVGVPAGTTVGAETRWSNGNFDKTGEIRAVISGLFPDCTTPVRLMEHFVNEGLRLVGARVLRGHDLPSLFDAPPDASSAWPEVLFGKYHVVRKIGGGGMAETFQVQVGGQGPDLFLKRVRLDTLQSRALQREQQIYGKLQRREDAALLQVVAWETDDTHAALVTEFASGGSLKDFVRVSAGGRLSVPAAREIALQVLASMSALHAADVVHRDIKPDNVVLFGATWKLADFGIAKNLGRPQTLYTFMQHHTPGYAAPEQVDGTDARPEADVYSFGKLFVFMLSGQTDPDQLTMPSCRTLAKTCTHSDPSLRPSVEEIRRSLLRIAG